MIIEDEGDVDLEERFDSPEHKCTTLSFHYARSYEIYRETKK
jgi:hypothetical protein